MMIASMRHAIAIPILQSNLFFLSIFSSLQDLFVNVLRIFDLLPA